MWHNGAGGIVIKFDNNDNLIIYIQWKDNHSCNRYILLKKINFGTRPLSNLFKRKDNTEILYELFEHVKVCIDGDLA